MSATAETPAPANTDKCTGVFVVDVEATDKTPMTGVTVEFAAVHLVTGALFYARLYVSHPHPDIPALPVVERDAAGRLDGNARVYLAGHEGDPDYEAPCMWFARCAHPANGLGDGGPLGPIPICRRCADALDVAIIALN